MARRHPKRRCVLRDLCGTAVAHLLGVCGAHDTTARCREEGENQVNSREAATCKEASTGGGLRARSDGGAKRHGSTSRPRNCENRQRREWSRYDAACVPQWNAPQTS
jgi:hypothetical protein